MTFFDDLGVNAFPTIFTPQGDGNSISGFLGCQVFISLYSRQYLPRKGTETSDLPEVKELAAVIPDNIYPARGRKRDLKTIF